MNPILGFNLEGLSLKDKLTDDDLKYEMSPQAMNFDMEKDPIHVGEGNKWPRYAPSNSNAWEQHLIILMTVS